MHASGFSGRAALSFRQYRVLLLCLCMGMSVWLQGCSTPSENETRKALPNFLIIVVDDLGYTDLGVFGSEIRTPNLDRLARDGQVLSRFYVTPTCSPTRAELLTGVDHHLAGLGTMFGNWSESQRNQPGYEGYLNFDVVTIATLLRGQGYRTYMTGKWHLGYSEETDPSRRGFDRSFALLDGGASHFSDAAGLTPARPLATYRRDGEDIAELPPDFFSSAFFVDELIDYLSEHDQARPYFAYLSFTAPHWPLQVPDEDLDLYRGVYDEGYDSLRERRIRAGIEAGVFPPTPSRYPGLSTLRPWGALSEQEQRVSARKMEIYAAMVENMDRHVGRLVRFLEQRGELDNTFILFLSDNGAEGNRISGLGNVGSWVAERFDNSYENIGRINSYVYYDTGWAQASSGPMRLFKAFPTEGGIRVPAFVRFPPAVAPGVNGSTIAGVDVAPTIMQLAGVAQPVAESDGRRVHAMTGVSRLDALRAGADSVRPVPLGRELFGRRALVSGDWKILWVFEPYGTARWELYNLAEDIGETTDLADTYPDKLRELIGEWQAYEAANNVITPEVDRAYAHPGN